MGGELPEGRRPALAQVWHRSAWLPFGVDDQLKKLARARDGFRTAYPGSGTNVDLDVGFTSAGDVLVYLPRAAVLGLLSPFPALWVESGAVPGGTAMRRVAGVETVGLYAALALLPWAVWRWRARVEIYVIAAYCLGMTVIYASAVCNVGALYRFRYGFIMTLVALGLTGVLAGRGEPEAGLGPGRPGGSTRPAGGPW
jgi:hypothetical protein